MKLSDLTTEQLTAIFENNPSMFRDVYEEWYELTLENFKGQLETLGFEEVQINFTGFWSQGDGACFHGKYSSVQKLDSYDYKELETLHGSLLDSKVEYALLQHIGHYSHENSVRYDFDYEDHIDEEFFASACEEFMRLIYSTLEAEYDYLTSVDYFLEEVDNEVYDHLNIVQTEEGGIRLIQVKETTLL